MDRKQGVVLPKNSACYKMLHRVLNLNTGEGPEMDICANSTEPYGFMYSGDLPDSRVITTCLRRTTH
jgi:hypothetical protein